MNTRGGGDPGLFLLSSAVLVSCTSAEPPPEYHRDIAPIIARSCVSCHDGSGIAPGDFRSLAEITARAEAIRMFTKARMMPPFGVNNSGDCNTYRDARWLSDEEIEQIDRWVSDGMIEGAPSPVEMPEARSIDVTATAIMEEPYTPAVSGTDDFRCFVVDPHLEEDGYVTAYRVDPGDARVVHHVLVFTIDGADAEARARELDEADEGPGYGCFGGSLLPFTSSRLIAGFAPGTGATRFPEGTGIPISAGVKLVLQMHYYTGNGAFADQTQIAIEVARSVESPALIVGANDAGLKLAPGQASVTSGPTQVRIPGVGAFLRGVFPHMHQRGRTMSSAIVYPDESRTCLTRVDRWDFDRQEMYFFEEPIYGGSNDRIELSCTYDTRGDDAEIKYGESTRDEMCLLGLYVTFN